MGRQAILISHEENRNNFPSSHNRMHSATATLSIYSCSAKEGAHPIMNKLFLLAFIVPSLLYAQTNSDKQAPDAILLTIFLKHDQGMTLAEIQRKSRGFGKRFRLKAPPW